MSDYPPSASAYEAPAPDQNNNTNNGNVPPFDSDTTTTSWRQQQQQQQQQQPQHLPPPQPQQLPEGWEEMRLPQYGRTYYVDHKRQITTWDRPGPETETDVGNGGTGTETGISTLGNAEDGTDNVDGNDNGTAAVEESHENPEWQYPNEEGNANANAGDDNGNNDGGEANMPDLDENYGQAQAQHKNNNEEGGTQNQTPGRFNKKDSLRGLNKSQQQTADLGETNAPHLDENYGHAGQAQHELEEEDNQNQPPGRINMNDSLRGLNKGRQLTEKWDKNLEDLKAYKEENGHMNVPQKEGTLGRWVSNQRQFYSKRAKGGKTCLTDDRVQALDELGFVWALKFARSQQSSWEDKMMPKKRRRKLADPEDQNNPKAKKPNSTTEASISTKMLPDGSQVINTEEKMTHCDGSTVNTTTAETIKKRKVRLQDGTCILESTSTIFIRKIERIVLPPLQSLAKEGITENVEEKESKLVEGNEESPQKMEEPPEELAQKIEAPSEEMVMPELTAESVKREEENNVEMLSLPLQSEINVAEEPLAESVKQKRENTAELPSLPPLSENNNVSEEVFHAKTLGV